MDLSDKIESHRDRAWHRDPELRLEDAFSAERFIEDVGFCSALTDVRRPGASLYIAVCGRRDAHMPRNVQKDPESRLTWNLKDEIMRRGRVYYGKLARGRSTFIARRLVPHFAALWGMSRKEEPRLLSSDAQDVLKVLRHEWEMATPDLRQASGIVDRKLFNKALEELQRALKVIPADALYEPVFTYVWALAESRFAEELRIGVGRETALREIARTYLTGAGMTLRGELARATGLSAPDAGLGNWALVDEGFSLRLAPGVYCLAELS
jgi:hypothetical protein